MDNFFHLNLNSQADTFRAPTPTLPFVSLAGLLGAGAPTAGPLGGGMALGTPVMAQLLVGSLLSSLQTLSGIWGGILGGGMPMQPSFGGGFGEAMPFQAAGLRGFGGLNLPPLAGARGPLPSLGLPPLPGTGAETVGGGRDASPIDTSLDYKTLSVQQRNQLSGMSEEQRAALHLWGIQMGSAGKQDGGVLLNVLNHPEKFKPAEVALAKKLAAEDRAKYGGITGKSLDRAFFGLYEDLTGKDISQRYGNSPIHFASGEVDMSNRLSGKNGLSQYENEVLQLWGHSPLFTGGRIDGSIVAYAANSKNTLEANLDENDLRLLLDADKADGVVNGSALESTFIDTLDHIYNGGPAASQGRTMEDALAEASKRRAGLLPPVDPRSAASTQSVDFFAQLFGSNDPSQCPFLNAGGGATAGR